MTIGGEWGNPTPVTSVEQEYELIDFAILNWPLLIV